MENNSSLSRLYKAFINPNLYYLRPLIRIIEREVDIDGEGAEAIVRGLQGEE